MMKILATVTMAAVAYAMPVPEATSTDFTAWKAAHGKTYSAEEHAMRAEIFETNKQFIEAENAKGHTYTLGVGPFTDLTNEEFAA